MRNIYIHKLIMSSDPSEYINIINHTRDTINKWNKDQSLDAGDYLSIILILVTLLTTIRNSLKLESITKINVLSYLNKDSIKQIADIEKLLEELLLLLDASRICVALFHNGTSIGSYPFKRMSVIYEAVRSDAKSLKKVVKDIDLNNLSNQLLNLSAEHFTEVARLDPKLNTSCKEYLDYHDLYVMHSILLKNKIGVYGILEIQYLNNNKNNADTFSKESIIEEKEILINKILTSVKRITENKYK